MVFMFLPNILTVTCCVVKFMQMMTNGSINLNCEGNNCDMFTIKSGGERLADTDVVMV
jgi:hypothetical protein